VNVVAKVTLICKVPSENYRECIEQSLEECEELGFGDTVGVGKCLHGLYRASDAV
jgi:hypothetical protein